MSFIFVSDSDGPMEGRVV